MKNKILFLFASLVLVVLILNFVSSEVGCCVYPKDGIAPLCSDIDRSYCDLTIPASFNPSVSCTAGFPSCDQGACLSASGGCEDGIYQKPCVDEGGQWFVGKSEDIVQGGIKPCELGGCELSGVYKQSPMTYSQCNVEAVKKGLQNNDWSFHPGMTQGELNAQFYSGSEGACVYKDPVTNRQTCKRETGAECISDHPGDYNFHPGSLCTDQTLGTDCLPTGKNKCGPGDKVYFIDSCNNMANVYDENMYAEDGQGSPEITNYWSEIITDETALCDYKEGDPSCGNCRIAGEGDENTFSICRSYAESQENSANDGLPKPSFEGDYVCTSLSCFYDTNSKNGIENNEHYLNGESWCAETPGTVWHMKLEGGLGFENGFTSDVDVRSLIGNNSNEYNVPGSDYVRLSCVDGIVKVDPCDNQRKEICFENDTTSDKADDGLFTRAVCQQNDWLSCLDEDHQKNKDYCETLKFCQWVPGYRFDGEVVTTNSDDIIVGRNQNEQGSCVPLFAPGFKFWGLTDTEDNGDSANGNNNGDNGNNNDNGNSDFLSLSDIEDLTPDQLVEMGITCNLATFADPAVYETSWTRRRSEFKDKPTCSLSINFDAVQKCVDNCYAIPDYGKFSPDGDYIDNDALFRVFTGENSPCGGNFEGCCISDMKDYYCAEHDAEPTVIGNDADCAKNQNSKRKNYPPFFTNEEWLNSITNRSAYIGDCGYKPAVETDLSDTRTNLQTIWAGFAKVDADGNPGAFNLEKIYEGNKYVGDWRNR